MGDTVGHADSRVPGAAKAGMLHPGKLAPPLQPSLPAPCCHAFIHWQEHKHVPTQNTPLEGGFQAFALT